MLKKVIAGFATFIFCFASMLNVQAAAYSDMSGHWAYDTVNYLSDKGIINGYPDGTFMPGNTITVNEFIKLVICAKQYPLTHMDVQWLGWATDYAATAQVQNIIQGSEFQTGADFERNITRYEMARMVARAMDDNEEFPPIREKYSSALKDYSQVPEQFKEHVYRTFVRGVITGYEDGEFKGDRNATRAEAATMIARMINPNQRVKTVQLAYTEYIEPLDLFLKVFDMADKGNLDDILDYYTAESREEFDTQSPEEYMVWIKYSKYDPSMNIRSAPLADCKKWLLEQFGKDAIYARRIWVKSVSSDEVIIRLQEYISLDPGYVMENVRSAFEYHAYRKQGLWYLDLETIYIPQWDHYYEKGGYVYEG